MRVLESEWKGMKYLELVVDNFGQKGNDESNVTYVFML